MSDERKPEPGSRIPGTDSYYPPEGAVGRAAVEAQTQLGHDNLEVETEIEKQGDKEGRTPAGSGSFEVFPKKLD